MGLDMYLERFPRIGVPVREIFKIEQYLSWEKECLKEAKGYTFEQWTGIEDGGPRTDEVNKLRKFFHKRYSTWDDEHKYPIYEIHEEIGYWRKANEIHNWFVEHVQDGIDDCDYHDEVTPDVLRELITICDEIINSVHLVPGKIVSGYQTDENGNFVPIEIDGVIVEDDSLCRKMLPRTEGFFFGSYEYDERYINDLKRTKEICERALEETDFETQMIYYVSSW